MALLSVLNKKCGRMRDCSSASRALALAGARPLARATKAATSAAANAAPAAALASQGASWVKPINASTPQPYKPANTPSAMPPSHWPVMDIFCNCFFKAQAVINQASVAGSAAPVIKARRDIQSSGLLAPNITPMAVTASTNSTARSTTPTWQASKISACSGSACAGSSNGTKPERGVVWLGCSNVEDPNRVCIRVKVRIAVQAEVCQSCWLATNRLATAWHRIATHPLPPI